MKPVNQTLRRMLGDARFKEAHPSLDSNAYEDGDRMLRATLDEVRLHHADRFAKSVLRHHDIDDAAHFRHSVLRRELTAEVAYDGQRDHSAHTVTLYLLGWYIYLHSERFRLTFAEHAKRRERPGAPFKPGGIDKYFRNVWMWASLLHDVGYLFEGGLSALSSDLQADHVARGVRHVQDYFDHRLWSEIKFGVEDRRLLLEAAGIRRRMFESTTLAAVADSLRALPDLTKLHDQIWPGGTTAAKVSCDDPGRLSGDGFELWRQHYERHEQPNMVTVIAAARQAFEELVWSGIPGVGVRVLDHGVAGGLLLLQYSTFYFTIIATGEPDPGKDARLHGLWKRFRARDGFTYEPDTWWSAVLWGTGACAAHNVVQDRDKWEKCGVAVPKLSLEDDPVAYLGILVDILQDWDRYPVTRGSFLLRGATSTTKLPLESWRVDMGDRRGGGVAMRFPKAALKKVKDDLSSCLDGWGNLVELHWTEKV